MEESAKRPIPAWLEKDSEKLSGKVIRLASREDVDIPIEEHLIVEYLLIIVKNNMKGLVKTLQFYLRNLYSLKSLRYILEY